MQKFKVNSAKFKWFVVVCLLIGGYTNCAKNSDLFSSQVPTSPFKASLSADSSSSQLSVVELGHGSLSVTGQLYYVGKIIRGDGEPTYGQWIPNKSGVKGPVLIYFKPYDGIDFTGNALDDEWFARGTGTGVWPDTAGPYYDPATSRPVHYSTVNVADLYYPTMDYIKNDISVLVIYGRFYTSDISKGQADVVNAIDFLKTVDLVDPTKIAIYGESWGGFTSLYGMAKSDTTLAAAGFLYPMSDAAQAFDWAYNYVPSICKDSQKLDDFYGFFDAYRRRINKSTEAAAAVDSSSRYTAYSQSALSGIKTPMFVAHDTWDTIVPKTMSDNLIKAIPNTDSRHFFHMHTTDLDFNQADVGHTQLTNETMDEETSRMWARLFILNRLMPGQARYINYTADAVIEQFRRTRQMKLAGKDTSFYTPLLLELCDPQVIMVEATGRYDNLSGPFGLSYLYYELIYKGEGNADWAGVNVENVCDMMKKNTSVF